MPHICTFFQLLNFMCAWSSTIKISPKSNRKMRNIQMIIFLLFFSFFHLLSPVYTLPLAPALYVFGDSLVDNGNNNLLPTLARANYLPYGADFAKGPTGRFTDGRNVADFIAEYLGLPYPPPYLSFEGPKSSSGVNYASGACGIMPDSGSKLGKCLNMREQIDSFQGTVKRDLPRNLRNTTQLSEHVSKSIYIISVGSNDYLNNYLETQSYNTSKQYQPQPFAQLLIVKLSQQLERLYKLGARKMIIFEIGPLGCIPNVSKKHAHKGKCMEETNQMVSYFNERIPAMINNLTFSLPGSIFIIGHAYSQAYDIVNNPSKYGLMDGSNPCCTTWENGTSSCIPLSKPCLNPSKYVFWDAYHVTEAVYSMIVSEFLSDRLTCTPVSMQELVKM